MSDPRAVPVLPLSTPRRVAIAGCGRMGLVHADRLVADGRSEIVALADDNLAAAERLRDQYASRAPAYAQLPALLAEAAPEIVLICTPTAAHFVQVAACQERRLNILCEKPLADSRARIAQLISAAEISSALHAIAYQRRSWGTYRAVRREVLSGRWGPVRAVSLHASEAWQQTIAGTWRDDPQANYGGFIGDAGSHKIDAVFFVTGLEPREVFARSWRCGSHVEVVTSVSAVLEGDIPLGMQFVGNGQILSEDLHVHCAEAEVRVRDGRAWIIRDSRIEALEPTEPDTNPVVAFLDALDGAVENCAPFSCARPVFDFTAAVLESAASGRGVAVR